MMLRQFQRWFLTVLVGLFSCVLLFAAGAPEEEPEEMDPELELEEIAPGVPRSETLILQPQDGRIANPDRFNPWVAPQPLTHGLQQGALDTLWYVGQLDGTWSNALAAERPEYNDDFTELTVQLREGIYWSDGEPFTAEDVIATVEVQMENDGMEYTEFFRTYVDSVTAPDDHTVVFELSRPNSRFHVQFVVRWSAAYIMPAHIFREVDNPVEYEFNPPVSLGQYVLKDYDSAGYWTLWEVRDDWERTWVGQEYGEPGPNYLLYIHYGDASSQTIAHSQHNLDISQLWAPEAYESLRDHNPDYAMAWHEEFPYATFGDPAAPGVTLNTEVEPLDNRDVRWALALTINPVETLMSAYDGAARVTPIANTPTDPYYDWYYGPMTSWLEEFELDVEVDGEPFRPFDPDVPLEMAARLIDDRGHDHLPDDEDEIRRMFGIGWWQYAPEVAAELLERNGFSQNNAGQWLTPEGDPFEITILTMPPDTWPLQARLGGTIASRWREFGIRASHDVHELTTSLQNRGEFEAAITWPVETWGGHPDMHRFLQFWHSDQYRPVGESTSSRNPSRWTHSEMDRIVDAMGEVDFDSEETIDLGIEAMKLMVDEMPLIPMVGQNQLNPVSTYYWENWPTAENPYAYPLPSGANYKRVFPQLESTGR